MIISRAVLPLLLTDMGTEPGAVRTSAEEETAGEEEGPTAGTGAIAGRGRAGTPPTEDGEETGGETPAGDRGDPATTGGRVTRGGPATRGGKTAGSLAAVPAAEMWTGGRKEERTARPTQAGPEPSHRSPGGDRDHLLLTRGPDQSLL